MNNDIDSSPTRLEHRYKLLPYNPWRKSAHMYEVSKYVKLCYDTKDAIVDENIKNGK